MCCYCIEEYILSLIPGTIFYEEDNTDLIEAIPDGYLQETSDLETAIKLTKSSQYFSMTKTIYLCKLIEKFINDKFNEKSYSLYVKNYRFKEKHKFNSNNTFINFFHNNSNFNSEKKWINFIESKSTRNNIKLILKYYTKWWIDELEYRVIDINRADSAKSEDLEQFEFIFPAVFFSLCLSIKMKENQKIIEKIALKCPAQGRKHHFACNDLWLQRKALTSCVDIQGHHFIIDNIEKISENHIHYILAKSKFSIDNVQEIRDAYIKFSPNISNPDRSTKILLENFDRVLKNKIS